MSLKMWYPLTGHLNNQGLSDCRLTTATATVNANGKLGSCYSFASGNLLLGTHDFLSNSTDDWSYCCWMKLNATTVGQCLFSCRTGTNSTGITIFYYGTQWLVDDGVRWTLNPRITISANTWYHICFVRKKGVGKYLYVNGELDSSTTTTGTQSTVSTYFAIGCSQSANTTATGNPLNGYLNDVRVYDHALSIKEIKEISKGLVCHYTLGDIGGCPNLLPYSKVSTTNKDLLKTNILSSWNNLSITTIDGFGAYLYPTAQNSTWFSTGYWYKNMAANTTYTYSAYIYQDSSSSYSFNFTSLGHFQVYNSSSTASDKSHEDVVSARVYFPTTIPPKTWTKISITFTTNTLAGSNFQVYPRYNIGANTFNLYFRDCKLELGNKATPWIPNTSDTEYTTMGYNDTTVYDSSGYNYHGTINTAMTVSSNTARYSTSTKFNGTDNAITIPYNTMCPTNIFTMNIWFYKDAIGSKNYETLFGGPSGFEMDTRAGTATTLSLYMASTRGSILYEPLEFNKWNMITMVRDGTNELYYVNGELKKTITAKSMPTGTYFIGAWRDVSSQNYYGLISDFRLYSTCLSADDIKSLYQVGASIDKNGNMFTYELREL